MQIRSFALACLSTLLTLALVEFLLRLFLPVSPYTLGHIFAPNAILYGWGYRPGQVISVNDPDTKEVYIDYANNHGWRDRKRSFDNSNKNFRVVVVGDSNVFGAIVPQTQTYTAILEKQLQASGYKAEIINIGYAGWGTDQALEALKNHALKYKPQLVIYHFCTNDLIDNRYFALYENAGKILKPFYYELDNTQKLIRKSNQLFKQRIATESKHFKTQLKKIISYSEILKRSYLLYRSTKNKGTKSQQETPYQINEKKLKQIELVLGLGAIETIQKAFKDLSPSLDLTEQQIEARLITTNLKQSLPVLKRILKKNWFDNQWSPEEFFPKTFNQHSEEAQLLFALIKEMAQVTNAAGTDLAIISDNEIGHYQWERYWYRISSDQTSKDNYLSPTVKLKNFSKKHGIKLIEAKQNFTRAKKDPHPNKAGNQVIAKLIYDFILQNYLNSQAGFAPK